MRVVVTHPTHQHAYETAVAAQRSGALERFVTGIYRRGTRRWHPGLDPRRVSSLAFHDAASAAAARTVGGRVDHLGWMLRGFDSAAARRLGSWPSEVVHAYEGAALDTLRAARRAGRAAVLDVPSAHERFAEVAAEEDDTRSRFPTDRINAERETADLLLAPSELVRGCLVENGVPAARIVTVPYGADPGAYPPTRAGEGPVEVVFVGQVGRRKGVQHLLDAWRRLRPRAARLTIAGPARERALVRGLPPGVRWAGPLRRAEVARLLAGAHVFAFPSLAEGSAIVTYQAMAAGLPSVVTAESGSQVRDGLDGVVVPRRDPAALAEGIATLVGNRALRERMGASARARIEAEFTWEHYRTRLLAAWKSVLA